MEGWEREGSGKGYRINCDGMGYRIKWGGREEDGLGWETGEESEVRVGLGWEFHSQVRGSQSLLVQSVPLQYPPTHK